MKSSASELAFLVIETQVTALLSSSLGNTVLLHTLFLEYETQIGEKILDNVFQSNCSSCITSGKSEKNQKTA